MADASMAPYTTSKFACVGFSEALRADLEPDGVGVSILCPGPIATSLGTSDRLRPDALGDTKATSKMIDAFISDGMPPDEVAEFVVGGIRENAKYIFTHPEMAEFIVPRLDEIKRALGA